MSNPRPPPLGDTSAGGHPAPGCNPPPPGTRSPQLPRPAQPAPVAGTVSKQPVSWGASLYSLPLVGWIATRGASSKGVTTPNQTGPAKVGGCYSIHPAPWSWTRPPGGAPITLDCPGTGPATKGRKRLPPMLKQLLKHLLGPGPWTAPPCGGRGNPHRSPSRRFLGHFRFVVGLAGH